MVHTSASLCLVSPWLLNIAWTKQKISCYNKLVLNRLGRYWTTTSKLSLGLKLDTACACTGVCGCAHFFLFAFSSVLQN